MVKIRRRGGVAIGSNVCETPIHATNREVVNDLLADEYEVGDDILPDPENKPSPQAIPTSQYTNMDRNGLA